MADKEDPIEDCDTSNDEPDEHKSGVLLSVKFFIQEIYNIRYRDQARMDRSCLGPTSLGMRVTSYAIGHTISIATFRGQWWCHLPLTDDSLLESAVGLIA